MAVRGLPYPTPPLPRVRQSLNLVGDYPEPPKDIKRAECPAHERELSASRDKEEDRTKEELVRAGQLREGGRGVV